MSIGISRGRRPVGAGLAVALAPLRAVKGLVLTLCCLVVVVPLLAVVSTSLADPRQVNEAGGFVLWPRHPSLAAYRAVFAGGVVTHAILVSVAITLVGTVLSLASTALLAYGLSRPGSLGSRPILMVLLFSVLFSPGIIPMYLVVKQLGLLNSYWSLILPVLINGFNVIVMREFFLGLPQELLDAARIDGAGELSILFRVVLPLSKAILAVVGLFYAVAYWNSFFSALLYLADTVKWPLQLVLRTYVVNNAAIGVDASALAGAPAPPQQSLQMAILVISLVPILLLYPLLQRHFAKGILLGAVKG
ncbi:carbohydrate ABC transporter permease [Rugosimonospora acidiphila]|uniref:Carbohydrate ABC transporter permease n=1 Tax=Rugosimonospora acidiphila TaxID=556531 RepID=A0ABP9RLK1_9ACTN